MKPFDRVEIIKDFLTKFPETPSQTLAKAVYKQHPDCFSSVEGIRSSIKYYRGKSGAAHLKGLKDKSFVQPEQSEFCPFPSIPEGITEYADWTPVSLEGSRFLLLADLHIPYHYTPALTLALNEGKGCDHIILNGDICDFYAVSQWQKDPRARNLEAEIKTTIAVLTAIRRRFPSAHITFKLGNHEERWQRYMEIKAPELLGCSFVSMESLFQLDSLDIKLVSDKRIMKIGDHLNIIHGHEFGKGVASPVNPARGLYTRGKECCIAGHNHQTSQHSEKSMEDKITGCWSVGCLCDMHPEYMVMNKWNHGFALVDYNVKDGFTVHNKQIINGKIY